jgi:membrane protein implicated in regulation of membrane protease activity
MMDISFWHWLILGFLLIGAEVVVPGTFLLWPGIAALLTGVLAYVLPTMTWQAAAIFFALLTVASALAGRRLYARLKQPVSDEPMLNRRAQQYIGTIHTLATPILDGQGRMKVGDGTWKVVGEDAPVGARVKVVGVEGIALRVERLE